MPTATIIICTHNRAHALARSVEGAVREADLSGAEVLVVDNASTDDTPAVLAALAARLPALRIAHETQVGLSAARNRGLAEARGEIAVYLDDDAVPRAGWLEGLLAPYADPGVACVGGRIVLHFPTAPPAWVTPAFHPAVGAFDLGDRPRRLRHRPGDWFPCGANISFRASVARRLGGFSTLVGPHGRRHLLHDEADLCSRIDRSGGEVHYTPAAVVDHWALPEKLTPQYLIARQRASGESAATYVLRNRGLLRGLWGVRWYGPFLAALPYTPREPVDPGRLFTECQRREALGYLVGLARGIVQLRTLRRDTLVPGATAV